MCDPLPWWPTEENHGRPRAQWLSSNTTTCTCVRKARQNQPGSICPVRTEPLQPLRSISAWSWPAPMFCGVCYRLVSLLSLSAINSLCVWFNSLSEITKNLVTCAHLWQTYWNIIYILTRHLGGSDTHETLSSIGKPALWKKTLKTWYYKEIKLMIKCANSKIHPRRILKTVLNCSFIRD